MVLRVREAEGRGQWSVFRAEEGQYRGPGADPKGGGWDGPSGGAGTAALVVSGEEPCETLQNTSLLKPPRSGAERRLRSLAIFEITASLPVRALCWKTFL